MKKNIQKTVIKILDDVRKNGDIALLKYSKKFDNISLKPNQIFINKSELKKAYNSLDKKTKDILNEAKKNILKYHNAQMKNVKAVSLIDKGLSIKEQIVSVDTVGVYVPGGRFPYPSSVLMNVLPAKSAGVKEIIVATPSKNLNKEVKAALFISGADKVIQIGGAQIIAGFAYGTKKVPKVDVIVGPGNAYVTEAKKQVFGVVGIDMLAGPSEVMVYADDSVPVEWICEDLLAQAEHDPNALATLISTSKKCINNVKNILKNNKQIAYIFTKNIQECAKKINETAPEHLELLAKDSKKILPLIKNAGAIFLGPYTSVPMGDYWIGSSHTLPTGKSAYFSSGLSVYTFLKRRAVMSVTKDYINKNGEKMAHLPELEGMTHHKKSILKRL